MKKRFIFDENYIKRYAKKDKMRWLIIGGCALVLIIIIIIVILASMGRRSTPSDPVLPAYEFKEELTLESGSELPEVVDYFTKLENIDIDEIEVIYPEEFELSYNIDDCNEDEIEEIADKNNPEEFACAKKVLKTPAEYGVTIKLRDKEYTVVLKVVDTQAPIIITKDVEIYEGEEYSLGDFIRTCYDSSDICDYNYYNFDKDSEGNIIDYGKITKPGEYTIKIYATDAYQNVSDTVEAKLIINKVVEPLITISFNSDGGSAVNDIKTIQGGIIVKPVNPTKEGYYFVAWYNGEEEFNFNVPVTTDVNLVAKWEKIPEEIPDPPKPPVGPNGGDEPVVQYVRSVSLNYSKIYLNIGNNKTVVATVNPSNAVNGTVSWSSSDNSIATVKNGVITGVKAGTVTITATAGGKSASVEVVVKTSGGSATCPYGDASYNKDIILSVSLINNGCAVDPNRSYDQNVLQLDHRKLLNDLTNMGFRLTNDTFKYSSATDKIKNNTGIGLVGYRFTVTVSVIDPDNPYIYMSATYVIKPDGSRQFINNNIQKNGVKFS